MPSQFTWAGRGPQIVRLAILGRKLGLVRLAGVRERTTGPWSRRLIALGMLSCLRSR